MARGLLEWLAQRTYESLLASTASGPQPLARRARRRVMERLRQQLIVVAGDPAIRHRYLGRPIVFPLSHSLLLYEREHDSYGHNLTRIAAATFAKYPDLHAIDIGGNIGDSVLLLRQAGVFPVLTIEGDPRFVPVLQRNLADVAAVDIEPSFVGTGAPTTLAVVRNGGTSRLAHASGTESAIEAVPLPALLAQHPAFVRSKLLKLDLDGLDFAVLTASRDWIASACPVVFMEYDPTLSAAHGLDGITTLDTLRSLGYSHALVWDNHGNFLLGTPLDARDLLLVLDRYVTAPCGLYYWDVCCVHSTDADLFRALREGEATRQRRPIEPPIAS